MKKRISLVHEAGQSLVEFALVTLFVILPVTFGIIDGSILFYKWVNLTNGAREGARAGAIYHYDGTEPSNGSKAMMLSIDAARAKVITQTVEAMVRPL
ncbi:MAG: pilus assembly protein, partial [Anaerolineae bacterium]|nr:pilus assembly protein [Anaerolineae bacterium]